MYHSNYFVLKEVSVQNYSLNCCILGKFPESCVTKCQCYSNHDQGLLVADCSNSGINNLSDTYPEHTDWLRLSGNNFTVLSLQNNKVIQMLKSLSILDLNSCKVRNISSQFFDIFKEDSNLLHLGLSNNELITIPKCVQNLSSLQTLRIVNNKFKCSCDNIWMERLVLK